MGAIAESDFCEESIYDGTKLSMKIRPLYAISVSDHSLAGNLLIYATPWRGTNSLKSWTVTCSAAMPPAMPLQQAPSLAGGRHAMRAGQTNQDVRGQRDPNACYALSELLTALTAAQAVQTPMIC